MRKAAAVTTDLASRFTSQLTDWKATGAVLEFRVKWDHTCVYIYAYICIYICRYAYIYRDMFTCMHAGKHECMNVMNVVYVTHVMYEM